MPLSARLDRQLSKISSLTELTRCRIRSWSSRVPAAEALNSSTDNLVTVVVSSALKMSGDAAAAVPMQFKPVNPEFLNAERSFIHPDRQRATML